MRTSPSTLGAGSVFGDGSELEERTAEMRPAPAPAPAPAAAPSVSAPPPAPTSGGSAGGFIDAPDPTGSAASSSRTPASGDSFDEDDTSASSAAGVDVTIVEEETERTAGVTPQPLSVSNSKDYDIMPVFYGTNRKNDAAIGKKPDYGSSRGDRLAMGYALVSVPKIHTMPNVERPWSVNIPYIGKVQLQWENPKKHFTIKELREMERAALLALIKEQLAQSKIYKDQALIFIHGFNNSFEGALFRTAQIAFDLKFDGAPFMYSWPSAGGWGINSYNYDRVSASTARPHLKEFLRFVSEQTGAKQVNIIAHSMGTFALLNVLRDLRFTPDSGVKINQIILAAPDIDRGEFQLLAQEIRGISQGITLYASSKDRALDVSEQVNGAPRAGDVLADGPIVVAGVDSIDVSAISSQTLSTNHSSYAQTTALMHDIELLLKTGTRPPQFRLPSLEMLSKPDSNGTPTPYWRFPASSP